MTPRRVPFARVLPLIAAVASLAGASRAPAAGGNGPRILASFYPIYIHLLNVTAGVPGVTVDLLAPATTGCLHDFALAPGDLVRLSEADALVINGGGMEHFLDAARRQRPGLTAIDASRGIDSRPAPGEEPNPHVWLDPAKAAAQVRTIADGLAALDPPHADAYRANAEVYAAKLDDLRRRLTETLAPSRGRAIVTFHESFPHFARAFGLDIAAVIRREPGSEPSARQLAETIDLVRRRGIRALFVEPQFPPRTAEAIARETGGRVYVLDPAVTGPLSPDAYLRIMEANRLELERALK
jgi:zinc transport system substrate-binding protein